MKKTLLSLIVFLGISSPALASENFPIKNLTPLETKKIEIEISENTPEKNFSIPQEFYDAPSVTLQKLVTSKGKCTLQDFEILCKNLKRGDKIFLQARVRSKKLSFSENPAKDPLVKLLVSEGTDIKNIITPPTPAPKPISENFSLTHDNKVLFTDGITIEKEVKNADAKTFTEKKGTYAQDKKNFYYGEVLVEKNTEDDFKYLGAGFSKKNEKIFIAEKIFQEVEDAKTFSPLKISENNWSQYSKDAKASYYKFTKIFTDTKTLKALGGNYAVDKNNIYFRGGKISSGSAKYLGEGKYGEYFLQDNGGFFLNGVKIPKEKIPEKILENSVEIFIGM